MKLSMGQITTLPKTMEEDVASYEKAGFSLVELAFPTVNRYLENHTPEQMRELLDRHGLRAVSAIGMAPTDVGIIYARGAEAEIYFRSLEAQLRLCSVMGCEFINLGSDDDKFHYDGYEEQAVANLRRAGDLAARYQMKVALEDGKMDRCMKLVYGADHPNVFFCIDFFWYIKHGYTVDQFKTFDMSRLLNIHFCDLPQGYQVETMDDSVRILPGEGVLPLREWLRWLEEDQGFDGYCCLELLNEELWEMGSDEACFRCMEAMKKFFN